MTDRRWWQARWFVVSGTFLIAILLLGAVTLLMGHGSSLEPTAPIASGAVRPDPQACHVPAADQRVPVSPPAAHWNPVGERQYAPGSTVFGPARTVGNIRTCYARSPTGAVFAAYNFFATQWEYPGDTRMLRALTAAGQVRDDAIRHGGSPPHDPSWTVRLVGFRVMDYSPSAVTVRLAALATPTSKAAVQGQMGVQRLAAAPLRLRWERGDWKVVAEPDGFSPELIDSLAGLVPWAAPA